MNLKRIISKIDIKGNKVVKGVHFEGLRILGDPYEFALEYYNNGKGVDEIFFQDVTATLYQNNCLFDFISQISKNIFIPIIVGGGLRTVKEIEKMFIAGADRVSLNSQALKNPKFINEVVKIFGSANIALNIEAMKVNDDYYSYYHYGRDNSQIKVLDWAKEAEDRGAGEIIISSIDFDGSGKGFNKDLVKKIKKNSSIPISIHGGCSKTQHIVNILENDLADGIVISSMFHYNFLKKKNKLSHFTINKNWESVEIQEIKKLLLKKNIKIRN